MLGWLADFFRFTWALLYWNFRKAWFRFRRGRVACPCQSPSDSGKALETHCEACVTWNKAERFRRVCPLLVRTKDGLRCAANTDDVRPFWGIAIRYYGGTLAALYAAAVVTVFAVLRTVGYPVSIVHVALPPMWHRVGEARGWYFLMRSQEAFAAGRGAEGLLYLANAYEFDPHNYDAGLALAKAFQLPQPARSDEIFARLLRDHPDKQSATAQHWFRALLPRGDFEQITALAREEVLRDRKFANVWMRALVFATRQRGDTKTLTELLNDQSPAARPWHRLLEVELMLRARRDAEARAAVTSAWAPSAPPFTLVFRVETLLRLAGAPAALDLLDHERARIDDEAWLTLRLHCLAAGEVTQTLRHEFNLYLLSQPLSQPRLKIMCAQLIRHPDRELMDRLAAKVAAEKMPLTDETAGGWFSLLCTTGAVGDLAQLRTLTLRLRAATQTPFAALLSVESFFRRDIPDTRATSFLPFLPLPLEVTYALLERYPPTRGSVDPATGIRSS